MKALGLRLRIYLTILAAVILVGVVGLIVIEEGSPCSMHFISLS